MNEDHKLSAFHFKVLFKGLDTNEADSGFQSVSGLKAAIIRQEDSVRDQNKNPVTLFNPLVLRRAITGNNNSPLRQWILRCLNASSPEPLPEVLIEVLNDKHSPEMIIRLTNVTAAAWELGELHAQKNELLMEEITLHYQSVEMIFDKTVK